MTTTSLRQPKPIRSVEATRRLRAILRERKVRWETVLSELERGADPDTKDFFGWPALCLAAQDGRVDVMEAMLAAGADPNAQDGDGRTALMMASQNGRTGAVRLLLHHGAHVNLKDRADRSALHWAAGCVELEAAEVAEALLAGGAEVDATTRLGSTPLMVAAEMGAQHASKALLGANADINIQDSEGRTAMARAIVYREPLIAVVLIRAGADLKHAGIGRRPFLSDLADPQRRDFGVAMDALLARQENTDVRKLVLASATEDQKTRLLPRSLAAEQADRLNARWARGGRSHGRVVG